MSDSDLYISNGTCVFAPGKLLDDSFLPCGNSVFGHVHCCTRGEVCLDNNACYSDEFGTTYLAGCTDSNYNDESCPDKKDYHDYPWAGLIYCKPNQWVACKETDRPTTVTKGDPCTCPPSPATPTAAFTTGSVITRIGRLPGTLGGRIEWENGHFPTMPTMPATSPTSTISSHDSTSTSTTTATSTSTPTSDSPLETSPTQAHTLSTPVKAGIGIGAVFGAMILLGALSALWMVCRRRFSNHDNNAREGPATGLEGGPVGLGPGGATGTGQDNSTKHVSAGPVEMPTPTVPAVPPRPEYPGDLGPWTVRPDLIPAGGYGAVAGAGAGSGQAGYEYGTGWQNSSQGWDGGALAENREGMGSGQAYGYGQGYDQDQGYGGQAQGYSQDQSYGQGHHGYEQGVWDPRGGERPRQGPVTELPA